MSAKETVNQFLCSTKTGTTVVVGNASFGAGSWLDLIPDDIGKLSTLVGLAVAMVVIYAHYRRIKSDAERLKMERDMHKLQIEKLKMEIGG